MKHKMYAIDMRFRNKYFRFAEDRLIQEIDSESGSIPVVYLPYIISISEFVHGISFVQKSPLPNLKVEISDPFSELYHYFNNLGVGIEEVSARVMSVSENEEVISEVYGSVSNFKFKEGRASFDVRVVESQGIDSVLKYFRKDSFQWLEYITPVNLGVQPTFIPEKKIPWTVFRRSLRKKQIGVQDSIVHNSGVLVDGGYIVQGPHTAKGGYQSELKLLFSSNTYTDFERVDGFWLKVTSVSGTPTIDVEISSTVYSGTGTSAIDILESLQSDIGGDFSTVLDEGRVRLYVSTAPSNVDVVNSDIGTLANEYNFFFDPDAVGTPGMFAAKEEELFTDPDGATYAFAVLGESHSYDTTELIAYSNLAFYATEIVMLGVPTNSNQDPAGIGLAAIQLLDPEITDLDHFVEKYGIQNNHKIGSYISPLGEKDVIYVAANGLVPESIDDPKLGVGYISFNDTISDRSSSKKWYKFRRYKMTDISFGVVDQEKTEDTTPRAILKLEMHNRFNDPGHEYAVESQQGIWEVPFTVKEDHPVILADWSATLTHIDVGLLNATDAALDKLGFSSEARESLRNRYRGFRVDMINDLGDLSYVYSQSTNVSGDPSSESLLNQRVINNASGGFGVCTGSEIVINNIATNEMVERLYFYNKFSDSNPVKFLYIEALDDESGESVDLESSGAYVDLESGRESFYMNFFTFQPLLNSAVSQLRNAFDLNELSFDFFFNKRYRIVRDPVPENSDELGSNFPVVYGNVQKVPLMQVVSKKATSGSEISSGDDLYIISSHPIDVKSAFDITVHLGEESNTSGSVPNDDLSDLARDSVVQSPFPQKISDHFIAEDSTNYLSFSRVPFLNHPYHSIVQAKTLQGDYLVGLRLRGGEWDYRLGRLDKRYPVRNGVGSTKLFGSYGGYVDRRGDLISHPIDILTHYIKTYGRWPYNENIIDIEALEVVKSVTRNYEAAVFMNQPLPLDGFIDMLFKQFCLFPFIYDGSIRVSDIDLDRVDFSKPVMEGLNLMEGLELGSIVLKDIYSEVIVNFKKNWSLDSFEGKIHLDKSNNAYCALASKALTEKKVFEIDCIWLNDPGVAQIVANKYSRLLCSVYVDYKCQVRNKESIRFFPGDVVPFSISEFNLDSVKAVVMSVSEGAGVTDLILRRYVSD